MPLSMILSAASSADASFSEDKKGFLSGFGLENTFASTMGGVTSFIVGNGRITNIYSSDRKTVHNLAEMARFFYNYNAAPTAGFGPQLEVSLLDLRPTRLMAAIPPMYSAAERPTLIASPRISRWTGFATRRAGLAKRKKARSPISVSSQKNTEWHTWCLQPFSAPDCWRSTWFYTTN